MIKNLDVYALMLDDYQPSPEQRKANDLANLYHVKTEQFDRRLPGDWSHHEQDVWIPRGSLAKKESADFAVKLFKELKKEAAEHGVSSEIFVDAVRHWKGHIPR